MMASGNKALISVSDKSNVIELAKSLTSLDIEILSTGGTAQLLRGHNIAVTDVSSYTGFPEIMDGRVKTLHPKILGGILGRPQYDEEIMRQHHIDPIDLVVINLYPFAETIANPSHSFEDAIENIDIGGPTMIRAAAKNHQHIAVVVDPNDYDLIITELRQHQQLSSATRFYLAKKAFAYTAKYDATIANYLGKINTTGFPETLTLQYDKKMDLRYGENPHQQAAFYQQKVSNIIGVANAEQIQGKALSYNNIADADAALSCVQGFVNPACVIVKHANPCGVAETDNLLSAYDAAYKTDPTSAFGGIIAFNREVDAKLITKIISQQFVEVIIAPAFAADAIDIAKEKPNIRLLATGYWSNVLSNFTANYELKHVNGGLLIQEADVKVITPEDLRIVTQKKPNDAALNDLLFAWKVVKFVKSNAIVYAKDGRTIGIGAGQMSRVYSAKIAQIKALDANLSLTNSVLASDAFFPFRDSVDAAAAVGVTAIIQPGGSMRDQEVIDAANEAGIAMVFTGIREFRH